MKKNNVVFAIIIAILMFYTGNRFSEFYHQSSETNVISKIANINSNFDRLYTDFRISLKSEDLICGFIFSAAVGLTIMYIAFNKKNYMYGKEHGSAKWGNPSEISKLIDPNEDNNMIFSATERMSLNTRRTFKNNNVLVIGSAGSGKTRFVVKPNLMQLHSSYVITDPKGSLLTETGKMFEEAGYTIKTLNLVNFDESMCYNPFHYIKSEEDILVLADMIIKNTGSKGSSSDPFWVDAEKMLYLALFSYVFYEAEEEKKTFDSVLQLLNSMEVREEDESFKNAVDYIFEALEEKNPNHFAVLQYKKFKLAAGKTAKSILLMAGVRLSVFEINKVKKLTSKDEINIPEIGEKKTVVYIITDDTSEAFNFLAGIFYSQLFNTLTHLADTQYKDNGNRLPIHVRCILDEFANLGQIPDFQKTISVIRSREISTTIIVQNPGQIEAVYEKHARTIIGNCDTTIFLGSGEEKTLEMISKKVGKATVDHRGTSVRKGSTGDYTLSDQISARDLITPDEVGRMPSDECLVIINGLLPFKSKKYNLTKHKRYKYLLDFSKDNYFDIIKYQENLKIIEKKSDEYIDSIDSNTYEVI